MANGVGAYQVLRLPMAFFDTQPLGRLVNRFARDTEAVDSVLPLTVQSFLNCSVNVLWAVVAIASVITWPLALLLAPLALLLHRLQARPCLMASA